MDLIPRFHTSPHSMHIYIKVEISESLNQYISFVIVLQASISSAVSSLCCVDSTEIASFAKVNDRPKKYNKSHHFPKMQLKPNIYANWYGAQSIRSFYLTNKLGPSLPRPRSRPPATAPTLWCGSGRSLPPLPPRWLWGRRGFTRQPENSKRAHFSSPAFQTPPKFHEKTSKRGKTERKLWRAREKKNAKFWAPPFGSPTLWGPSFQGLGARWAKRLKHQFGKSATQISAEVGRLRLGKVGQIFFWPISVWPKSVAAGWCCCGWDPLLDHPPPDRPAPDLPLRDFFTKKH